MWKFYLSFHWILWLSKKFSWVFQVFPYFLTFSYFSLIFQVFPWVLWTQHDEIIITVITTSKQKPFYTAWKVYKYGVFSGPYFPVFGLNTEIYGVNLLSKFLDPLWNILIYTPNSWPADNLPISKILFCSNSSLHGIWKHISYFIRIMKYLKPRCAAVAKVPIIR